METLKQGVATMEQRLKRRRQPDMRRPSARLNSAPFGGLMMMCLVVCVSGLCLSGLTWANLVERNEPILQPDSLSEVGEKGREHKSGWENENAIEPRHGDERNQLERPAQEEAEPDEGPLTYGVIVDCGSSGTRAHIYQWSTKLSYPELLHHIEPMLDENLKEVSEKFSPSLATFADKSHEELEQYVKRVADYIASKIPADRYGMTVIYLMATAGMRLLDREDQVEIMDNVWQYFVSNYKFRKVTTSVISGADEGMYRWISVNAKAKRFLDEGTNRRTKTYAVIEMGGASVQVVYQLNSVYEQEFRIALGPNLARTYSAQIVEPKISRHDDEKNIFRLHSTTFLGFGGDSAHQAYLDLLILKHYSKTFMKRFLSSATRRVGLFFSGCFSANCETSPAQRPKKILTITDPCAPAGFESDDLRKPTRMLHSEHQTIGFIVDEDDEKDPDGTFPVHVVGQGNYMRCKKYVEEMLWTAKRERLNCERKKTCTMDLLGRYFIPFTSMDFVGIGDFYHTTNTMLDLAGQYRHNLIVDRTKEICSKSLKKLEDLYKEIANSNSPKVRERIHSECFRAVWVDTFLVKGLRMPTDFQQLVTRDAINDDDPEWTLGAVLDESLAIEEVTEPLPAAP